MDGAVAGWLAELIKQTTSEGAYSAGLTVEVDDHPESWVQIIPEMETDGSAQFSGFAINFPCRQRHASLQEALDLAGLKSPPDTQILAHEPGKYGTIWVRPDIPLLALALFAGDILEKLGGAPDDYEISVNIEHGF
jgi:hypothetical protein